VNPIPRVEDRPAAATADGNGDDAFAAALPSRKRRILRRIAALLAIIAVVLLLILVPPLVHLDRYRHRIVQSIGASLGRRVQVDNVSLVLLPVPGLQMENFVVSESPAFGAEPVIHANTVTARLRLSSLWRRQVEISRIDLDAPSVNLVHLPDGEWNLDSILLQASHVASAPTAQAKAGPAPRFPYIEATGARLNLKMGQNKLPFSLTDTDFALWQPEPGQWRIRAKAHPMRTDVAESEPGVLSVEATLGRAPTLAAIPLLLHAEWHDAPLGQATLIASGRDMGWRGSVDLTADVHGRLGDNAIAAQVTLGDLRRADFVPVRSLRLSARCTAHAQSSFHTIEDLSCAMPQEDGHTLRLTATMPEVVRPSTWTAALATDGIAVDTLLDWDRLLTLQIAHSLHGTGLISGSLGFAPGAGTSIWTGELGADTVTLQDGTASPILDGPVLLAAAPAEVPGLSGAPAQTSGSSLQSPLQSMDLTLQPLDLQLGGKQPVQLAGQIDSGGYTLQMNGQATQSQLARLGSVLPQFGTGLQAALQRSGTFGAPGAHDVPGTQDLPGGSGAVNASLHGGPLQDPPASVGASSSTPLAFHLEGYRHWGGAIEWFAAPPSPAPKQHHRRR
jgi:hypothetical protein